MVLFHFSSGAAPSCMNVSNASSPLLTGRIEPIPAELTESLVNRGFAGKIRVNL